jgi:hypothetical protein
MKPFRRNDVVILRQRQDQRGNRREDEFDGRASNAVVALASAGIFLAHAIEAYRANWSSGT